MYDEQRLKDAYWDLFQKGIPCPSYYLEHILQMLHRFQISVSDALYELNRHDHRGNLL